MVNRWFGIVALLVFSCSGGILNAQKQIDYKKPVVDFDFFQKENNAIHDRTGNASITLGKGATIVSNGPLNAKALKFDGTTAGVSKLDLTKAMDRLDGFELSVAFWIRFDAVQQKKGETLGNDTGFGFSMWNNQRFGYSLPIIGPGNFSFYSVSALEIGKWHHIAITYSIDRSEAKMYLDGELYQAFTDAELFPLKIKWTEIGKFNGALAMFRIWDRALAQDEIIQLSPDANTLKDLRAKVQQMEDSPNKEFLAYNKRLNDEIKRLSRMSVTTIRDVNDLSKKIDMALKLKPAAKALAKTKLAGAPFALMAVQAISPEIRIPEGFPPDATFTDQLRIAAAKGEFEPVSFIVQPYKEIQKFEMKPSEMKSEDGGVIPASALDIKVVKCWYQASWNSYFNNSNQILVPDLLLNDENLVNVDEIKRKNYLRINYPDGNKYCDVNFTGTFETVKPFNYALEPVYDAKQFNSAHLVPGRGTQFWLTLHVPKDAKPGLYNGSIKTVCDGVDTGSITLTVRVFPFELPVAKTSYDLSKEYITYIIGEMGYNHYITLSKDLKEAERFARLDYKNLLDHNLRQIGGISLGESRAAEEIFVKDLQIRKEMGVPLEIFIGGGAADDFGYYHENVSKGNPTPEDTQKSLESFKKRVDRTMDLFKKHGDPNGVVFFYGIDEATGAGSMRYMSIYRDYIYSKGGKVLSSGWGNNYMFMPSAETMHAEAAIIDKEIADRWHAIKGRLISYAGPFAGPDNPDLMRRSHGMKMYRANYDGFFMLSYVEGLHSWNERVRGKYRNFSMAYPTKSGPVNSIAFEGLREGLDDIRYATLMRQLAEECFASKDLQAIYAAKKAIAWFELTDPATINLDLLRLEMADQIVQMMERLGKKVR